MLSHRRVISSTRQRGLTLIEVLVTLVVVAFGLLGMAGLQIRLQQALVESFQRSQAVVLLSDMASRLRANRVEAAGGGYTVTGTLGTDSALADCTTATSGSPRDKCEWSNALKGAAENQGSLKTGAMTGARGCIVQVQAPVIATCTPSIYQITVAWQGLVETKAPAVACASDLYGLDGSRRAISERIAVGLPTCVIAVP